MTKSFTEIGNLAKSGKAAAEHAADFDPPIYNIWTQEEIGEDIGLTAKAVQLIIEEMASLPKLQKSDKAARFFFP